jgi:hypothetical protein
MQQKKSTAPPAVFVVPDNSAIKFQNKLSKIPEKLGSNSIGESGSGSSCDAETGEYNRVDKDQGIDQIVSRSFNISDKGEEVNDSHEQGDPNYYY